MRQALVFLMNNWRLLYLEAPLLQCSVAETDTNTQCGAEPNPATQLSAARGLSSASRSGLLNATKIEESVTKEANLQFDDGQAGLQGVVKAVVFWVGERNSYLSQCGGSSAVLLAAPAENEFSQAVSLTDHQLDSFMSGDAMQPEDVSCLTNSMSGTNNGSECSSDWRLRENYGGDTKSHSEMGKSESEFQPFSLIVQNLGCKMDISWDN